jgi:nucleoside-diphosphate-sugar epimerase
VTRPPILVTGGTGFIGSRLALEAKRRGHAVAVLGLAGTAAQARNAVLLREAGVEVVLAPLADMATVRPLLSTGGVVQHLAAAQHEAGVPDEHFREVNVRGTERLLDACAAAGTARLVYGGTMGVYGRRREGVVDEDTPPAPDNVYGVTKLAAERAALARRGELGVVVARIAEAYGPGDPRLAKVLRGLERGRFPILGDGRNRHPLVYVDDVVEGLLLMGAHPAAVGEVFVLAGDERPTTLELVRAAAAALGRPEPRPPRLPLAPFLAAVTVAELAARPLKLRPPLHRRSLDFFRRDLDLSNAKARRALGLEPRIRLEEGLRRTVAWHRQP